MMSYRFIYRTTEVLVWEIPGFTFMCLFALVTIGKCYDFYGGSSCSYTYKLKSKASWMLCE